VITHLPAATAVKATPLIEHAVEVVLKVTGADPAPFVALKVCVPLPIVIELGLKPVMVCLTFVISIDLVMLVGAYLLSAACEAVITHFPAASTVKVVPIMEQTPDEFVEKITGADPAPCVAVSVCGALFAFIEVGLNPVIS
jgi:hypothetical protein